MLTYRHFWLMLLLALCLPMTMVSRAQEAPPAEAKEAAEGEEGGEGGEGEEGGEEAPEAPYNWQEERETLRTAINAEIKTRVEQIVTHEKVTVGIRKVAANYEKEVKPIMMGQRTRFNNTQKIRWAEDKNAVEYPDMTEYLQFEPKPIAWKLPIKGASPAATAIEEDLRNQLYATFDKACPAVDTEVIREKGQSIYPLIHWGPNKPAINVSFKLRGGQGVGANVEGTLRHVDPQRILVGRRWITRIDLDDNAASLFYPDANKKMVDAYVNQELRKYAAKRDQFVTDWLYLLLPDRLINAGYVPAKYLTKKTKTKTFDFLQRQSAHVKSWIPAKEFEARTYKVQYDKETEKQTAIVTKDWFTHASQHDCREDYVWCEPANDYVPTSKLEEETKRLEEEAKNKKENAN